MVKVDLKRRRVWIRSRRLHHGEVGIVLLSLGGIFTFHDRHDHPHWFPEFRRRRV